MPMAIARMKIEKRRRGIQWQDMYGQRLRQGIQKKQGRNGNPHNYSDKDLTHLITHCKQRIQILIKICTMAGMKTKREYP